VPAAPAQSPEQIRVLGLARRQEATIGGDDIHRQKVVEGEPVLAHEPAEPAAEGQARDARRGDKTTRRRKTERLELVIELSPRKPGLGAYRLCLYVDPDALHGGEIDYDAAIA
jgi:hypothetical protein